MRGIGGGIGQISPEQSVEATMSVDLFDAKTHSLLWRGIAQDTLSKQRRKEPEVGPECRLQDAQAVAKELVPPVGVDEAGNL
jgi:hypothetical protein